MIGMEVEKMVSRALDDEPLTSKEIAHLFSVPPFSVESASIQWASREKTQRANHGLAEVHAQIGLNIAPCPCNCMFCAFAEQNHVFTERRVLPLEEAIAGCLQFEKDGANAIFLMATADFSMGEFLETSQEIRRHLKPDTVLVANVGDCSLDQAKRLKDAGFSGVYHAVRLGEGRDTRIPVERRLKTFVNVKEAGLRLGTCLEPVGPEHSVEELVEKTLITRDVAPAYSGAARRISIPGTELAKHGMVSEGRMAHMLAVVRLALPLSIPGNCTHEPNVIGAAAGANLLWAEVGSNPRDTIQETEKARGMTVQECRHVFEEAELNVLNGPSTMYS